jgi:hypothetical protein
VFLDGAPLEAAGLCRDRTGEGACRHMVLGLSPSFPDDASSGSCLCKRTKILSISIREKKL